jgi:site-specific DNA-methyltransferase (adenine-specific)
MLEPRPDPYYTDAWVTIYHGDAETILPTITPCDLLIADPPYGNDFQSNRRQQPLDKIANDDGTYNVLPVLDLAVRKIGRGRHAYIFGPADLSSLPLTEPTDLIWDKMATGMGDLALTWGPAHEPIQFATFEPSKANREKNYGRLTARLRKGSVIHCQALRGAATGRHPNEKPVRLLRELIESSSVMDEVVLDPFAGVGSTGVAARLEGRRAVLIEVDERYCELAAGRVGSTTAALEAA